MNERDIRPPVTSSQHAQPSAEQAHKFFTHTALHGCVEIRELLGISYAAGAPNVNCEEDARKCYFHGILKELTKAGMRHKEEASLLVENSKHAVQKQDPIGEHFLDMLLQERIDVLRLHCRKLSEILIDLIGFGRSNVLKQYQHFLIVNEIDKKIRIQKNFSNYYLCDNQLIKVQIDLLKKKLHSAELKDMAAAAWYLKKENDFLKASINQGLLAVLPSVESFQRLPLRDYDEAFGKMSSSLHPQALGDGSVADIKRWEMELTRLGILFMHVVFAGGKLLGVPPAGGVIEKVTKSLKENKYPDELYNKIFVKPDIKVNDHVLVLGRFPAKVIAEKLGLSGKTLTIKFLSGGKEDEFVAYDLFPLASKGSF